MTIEDATRHCVDIRNLEFSWTNSQPVLSIARFQINPGERLFLNGPSGSGKSTLLGVIAGVFAPTSGEAHILDAPFHSVSAAARDRIRADAMGVIFQQFNLVPYLSLVENVLLPCRFSPARAARVGQSEAERVGKAHELLRRLGLGPEADSQRTAAELSVGQQQRVAAARALIGAPSLIIADEPTSALDAETRDGFIATLLAEAGDAAVLFVSHDASLAPHFHRIISLDAVNTLSGQDTPPAPASAATTAGAP